MRFCCSDAGDAIISGTTSAITPKKWDSAVLMPEILSSPALHQHLPPKNEILLFWCRRCYHLRHCFSIYPPKNEILLFWCRRCYHLRHYISNYPQKMRFCCSDAGDTIISGTTSAFTPQKWDFAVLMPEMLSSPALLQHLPPKKWDSAVLMPEILSSPALLQHSYSFETSRLLRQPLLKTNRSGTHGEVGLFISFLCFCPHEELPESTFFIKIYLFQVPVG